MLSNRHLRANAGVSLVTLMVGVSLFSVPASAQIRRDANNNGVVAYADPNFHGASQVLRGDIADLRPYGLNDKVSSLDIPAGQTWEVCQDLNYGNACQMLTGSVADLRALGLNDRISSLRRVEGAFRNGGNQNGDFRNRRSGGVYSQPRASQRLVFFDRTGYRGASTVVTNDAYGQGSIGKRAARSVEVRGGTWQLCDRKGRCTTINQSVSDLSQLGLKGQITSVRPVNNGDGQRRDPRDGNIAIPRDRNYGR